MGKISEQCERISKEINDKAIRMGSKFHDVLKQRMDYRDEQVARIERFCGELLQRYGLEPVSVSARAKWIPIDLVEGFQVVAHFPYCQLHLSHYFFTCEAFGHVLTEDRFMAEDCSFEDFDCKFWTVKAVIRGGEYLEEKGDMRTLAAVVRRLAVENDGRDYHFATPGNKI